MPEPDGMPYLVQYRAVAFTGDVPFDVEEGEAALPALSR